YDFFIFIFSCGRRHTTSKRDCSSDVCSSDSTHSAHIVPHQADFPGWVHNLGTIIRSQAVFVFGSPSLTATNTTGDLVIRNNTNFTVSLPARSWQKRKPEST